MPTRARIAQLVLLALLIAGAVVVVRAPIADPVAEPRQVKPGEVDSAIVWVVALSAPALAVLIFAALRFRTERRPSRTTRLYRPPTWRGALFALAAVLLLSFAFGLVSLLVDPQPGQRRRGGAGSGSVSGVPGPTGPSPGSSPPAGAEPEDRGADIELWSAVLVVLLLGLLAGWLHARRGQSPAPPQPDAATPPADEPALASAVSAALSIVDEPGGDPRTAIIRCYTAMEQALADAPHAAPQPADTPTDVLRRARESGQLHGDGGARLVGLFAEARYSSHPMTEADRTAAEDMLRAILGELRRPAWTRS